MCDRTATEAYRPPGNLPLSPRPAVTKAADLWIRLILSKSAQVRHSRYRLFRPWPWWGQSPSRSAMSSRTCCSATGPMLVPVVSTTRSTLMVAGRCAWATPNPMMSNLAQPSSPHGRARHDRDRVLPELEHLIGGDDDGRPEESRLAPRRRPEIAADDVTRSHQRRRSQTHRAQPRRRRRVGRSRVEPR